MKSRTRKRIACSVNISSSSRVLWVLQRNTNLTTGLKRYRGPRYALYGWACELEVVVNFRDIEATGKLRWYQRDRRHNTGEERVGEYWTRRDYKRSRVMCDGGDANTALLSYRCKVAGGGEYECQRPKWDE